MRLRSCLPAEATLVRLRRHTGWEWGEAILQERHSHETISSSIEPPLLLSGANY